MYDENELNKNDTSMKKENVCKDNFHKYFDLCLLGTKQLVI